VVGGKLCAAEITRHAGAIRLRRLLVIEAVASDVPIDVRAVCLCLPDCSQRTDCEQQRDDNRFHGFSCERSGDTEALSSYRVLPLRMLRPQHGGFSEAMKNAFIPSSLLLSSISVPLPLL
jgi:hypothetical protein